MQAEARNSSPPLESWIYTAATVMAAVLLVIPLVDAGSMPDSNAFSEYNSARIEATVRGDPERLVVLLGDSKLKYATESRSELPDGSATLLRIVQNRAVFSDFEAFTDEILNAKPALIVLQASLITHERQKTMDFRLMQQVVFWQLLAPDSDFNPHRIDQSALQTRTHCSGDFGVEALDRRLTRLQNDSGFGIDHADAQAARAFLREARERGISVAVLMLPNHPRLDAEMPSKSRYSSLMANAAADAIPVWAIPESVSISESDFCDFVHLAPEGRRKTSEWLYAIIADVIDPATSES